VRWDGGYHEGDTISQYYDNLVGKLIVWAPTRDRAIERMVRALSEFEIGGIKTTIPAHLALLQTAEFEAATHSTKWVEDEVDAATFATPASGLAVPPPTDDDNTALVERTVPVEVDGRRFSVKVWLPDQPIAAASSMRARPKRTVASGAGAAGSGTITAPMQGTIVKVLVEAGAEVEVGQAILVLEAMKMENNINAETTGTVKEIRVAAGDSVGTGDILAVIE
jgi:acetyl-CoA/propionyl-CoA carboxylase biotin carboxyl carrier protein